MPKACLPPGWLVIIIHKKGKQKIVDDEKTLVDYIFYNNSVKYFLLRANRPSEI
jgi:hypothetical protein